MTEAALFGRFLPELPHVSFLFVLFDLCMNSNKTLAMCWRPAWICLIVLIFLNEIRPPAPLSSSGHSDLHFSRLNWLALTCSKPLPPSLLLSGCPWAPHQELPHWSLGIASSHSMAPHILPQPLERLFPDRKKVGCVCDSPLERSGTQEPSWTPHVLALLPQKEVLDFYFSGDLFLLSSRV